MQLNRFTAVFIFCLGVWVFNVNIAVAQQKADTAATSLKKLLKANRYPIGVEGGELKGKGGKWLRKHALEATIVTIGETHGTQEIPAMISALIEDMRQTDEFDYLAIEVSPWTARQMTEQLKKGKKAYNQFIKRYPWAIPFYNFKNERDLVYQVVQGSDKEQPLWGLDQIFAFSTRMALDRLKELAPTDAARSAIENIQTTGASKLANYAKLQKLPEKIPLPISVYHPVTFDTLSKYFEEIAEAQQILNEIIKSIKIYRLNDYNDYASNQIRARYMRNNLREYVRQVRETSAEPPQIVIKVGAAHAYRGLTPNNALDVGNLAISLARSMGGKALNVAIMCGPGSKSTTFPARTVDCWPDFLGEAFKSLSAEHPVLFDLTEVHPKLHESNIKLKDKLQEFLWAFDAVVLIPNTKPAEPIVSPVKQ